MIAECFLPCFVAEVKTSGIVCTHGAFVISSVIVYQPHTLNGIMDIKKRMEYLHQIIRYPFVANYLTRKYLTITRIMQNFDVAKAASLVWCNTACMTCRKCDRKPNQISGRQRNNG